MKRGAVGAGATDRIGKTDPLRPIVVAVLEKILGELDLQPCTELAGRQQQQRTDRRTEKEADLGQARIVTTDNLQRCRDHDHHQQIAADCHQRQRTESNAARKLQRPFGVAYRRQCQDGSNHRDHRPAHRVQFHRRLLGQICDRIEIEIIGPDCGQRCHWQPDAPAGFRRGNRIEIMNQHQGTHRENHPQHQRGI